MFSGVLMKKGQPEAGPQRSREAGSDVVFTIGRHRSGDGDYESLETRDGDSLDKRGDIRVIPWQIRLEPRIRIRSHDFFEANQRNCLGHRQCYPEDQSCAMKTTPVALSG